MNYTSLKIQPYLESELLTSSEADTLTTLRYQCQRALKHNFSKKFDRSLNCPIKCNPADRAEADTQKNILNCTLLNGDNQKEIKRYVL